MAGRVDVDLNELAPIVRSLGDRARDVEDAADDARDLASRVAGLGGSAGSAAGAVRNAQGLVERARSGLFELQRELAQRAMLIAQYECNGQVQQDINAAMQPPKKGGGFLGAIHTGLDWAGWAPFVGNIASGLNGLIYLGQGDWENAALNGLSVLPFGKVGAKGIKVAKGIREGRQVTHGLEDGLSHVPRVPKPRAATPEHKAQAWAAYQERGGTLSYEQWSNRYDANMRNARRHHAAADAYREALGWPEREVHVSTRAGERVLDVADRANMRAVELKGGYQYVRDETLREIEADTDLIEQGWNIVWVFQGRVSEPLKQRLRNAGIPYVEEHGGR